MDAFARLAAEVRDGLAASADAEVLVVAHDGDRGFVGRLRAADSTERSRALFVEFARRVYGGEYWAIAWNVPETVWDEAEAREVPNEIDWPAVALPDGRKLRRPAEVVKRRFCATSESI